MLASVFLTCPPHRPLSAVAASTSIIGETVVQQPSGGTRAVKRAAAASAAAPHQRTAEMPADLEEEAVPHAEELEDQAAPAETLAVVFSPASPQWAAEPTGGFDDDYGGGGGCDDEEEELGPCASAGGGEQQAAECGAACCSPHQPVLSLQGTKKRPRPSATGRPAAPPTIVEGQSGVPPPPRRSLPMQAEVAVAERRSSSSQAAPTSGGTSLSVGGEEGPGPPTGLPAPESVLAVRRDATGNRLCSKEGCTFYASFGKKEDRIKTHCGEHSKELVGLMNLASAKCEVCGITASFGIKGGRRTHCAVHGKALGLVYLISANCEVCGVSASYGIEGGRRTHCADHGKALRLVSLNKVVARPGGLLPQLLLLNPPARQISAVFVSRPRPREELPSGMPRCVRLALVAINNLSPFSLTPSTAGKE